MAVRFVALLGLVAILVGVSRAEDRNTKVHNDRLRFEDSTFWTYNDFSRAVEAGKITGKPLLVVVRCIP